jgi:hypothetical protein
MGTFRGAPTSTVDMGEDPRRVRIFAQAAPGDYEGPSGTLHTVCFHPLGTPYGRLEGIGKILCFVDDLAALEFHDADRADDMSLVCDRVFRDPKIAGA